MSVPLANAPSPAPRRITSLALTPVEDPLEPTRARELVREEVVEVGVRPRHDEEVAELGHLGLTRLPPRAHVERVEERLAGRAVLAGGGPVAEGRAEPTGGQVCLGEERSEPELPRERERRGVVPAPLLGRRAPPGGDVAEERLRRRLLPPLASRRRELERFLGRGPRARLLAVGQVAFGDVRDPRGQVGPDAEVAAQADGLFEAVEPLRYVAQPDEGQAEERRRDRLPDRQVLARARLEAALEGQDGARQITAPDRDEARDGPGDRLA